MHEIKLIPTGIPNLDPILGGGVPVYSLNIIAGQPGTGKTIMAQQLMFHFVQQSARSNALYLTTLSEPTVKVIRYMQHFTFFDAAMFDDRVLYEDIGSLMREYPLPRLVEHIMDAVEQHKVEILVIDSFKAIRDIYENVGEFRRFCYDLSVHLASARCTTFLVGEYNHPEIASGAEFVVADGIFVLDIAERQGELYRFLQAHKMRGQNIEMRPFPFNITKEGMRILSSALTLNTYEIDRIQAERSYVTTGIYGLDHLLQGGIPRGYSILLSGVSGTGKTTFGMQFLMNGVLKGEKGLMFSFEETPNRLRIMSDGFGWDVAKLEAEGLLRIIFVPQTDIRVEQHLEQIIREVVTFRPHRLVIDSFSVLLHKIESPSVQREKTFQLASLAQQTGTVAILVSDIAAGEGYRLSRFGVEETVTDGAIILTTEMSILKRHRYLEVYKMRTASHIPGRHRMEITPQGMEILYIAPPDLSHTERPLALDFELLQGIVRGNLHYGSTWLVRGDPGLGKSMLSYQFAIEGLRRKEAVLYLAADDPAYQVQQNMLNLSFLPTPYLENKQLVILDAFGAGLDLEDPEKFLFTVAQWVGRMPKPLRVVFDSLTPLVVGGSPNEFINLVQRKNRLLRQPQVVLFDTILRRMLDEGELHHLLNAFDVVIDLYVPDWGEMKPPGNSGHRVLQIRKVRGATADNRPYPYRIAPSEGILVQKDHYGR